MLRRTIVVLKPAQITVTSISLTLYPGDENVCQQGGQNLESVAEASPSFPDVDLRTFAARNDVNQITGCASELVLESQLTARGVESPPRVGMGAGYAAGTATFQLDTSSWKICSIRLLHLQMLPRNQYARLQTAVTKTNLSPQEKEALFSLRQRNDVVVKPADKGGAVVVWARDLYIQKAEGELSDLAFYQKLDRDHTVDLNKKVTEVVHDAISKTRASTIGHQYNC